MRPAIAAVLLGVSLALLWAWATAMQQLQGVVP